jgi:hypothetical protein
MNTISGLINQFKQEQSAGMFKQGGKLAYLVNKFKNGVSMKTGITPKVNVQTNVTPDLSQGNFNQAFAAARSAGLTSFT